MNSIAQRSRVRILARLKLFFALSRTPHGILDLATPALAALLWFGRFPPMKVTLLGILTAFAGYTAVYALNDLVDVRTDKQKLRMGGFGNAESYLDGVMVRHPVARGLLSVWEGIAWTVVWAVLAVIGAYILNPICVVIFLAGCLLELTYCLLLKISPMRILVSGGVKTSGGIAAVFAVDPHPSLPFLVVLFLFLFFWEIGGQNIPADWTDMEEDTHLESRTFPVRFGPRLSGQAAFGTLILAMATNFALLGLAPVSFGPLFFGASLLAGVVLLILPARSLMKRLERENAMALFNRASYYPLALFLLVTLQYLIK